MTSQEKEYCKEAALRLKEILEEKGFSQVQFAKRLGVTKATVNRWTKDMITASQCVRICNLLDGDITPDEMRPDIFLKIKAKNHV